MNPIEAKVEIRFDGTNWVDVTNTAGVNYLVPSAAISITRGRDSETGDAISVGTCSLTLQNDDGRFSPDLPSSPYYPNVVEGVALRVSVKANGTYRPRFYGTVQSWSTGPMDETGVQATCAVTANDTLGVFPSYKFRQAADEVVRNTPGVLYHIPLRDSGSPAVSLVGATQLTDNGGDGWSASPLLSMDEGTDLHPLMKSSTGQLTLRGTFPTTGYWWFSLILTQPTANGTILSVTGSLEPFSVTWNTASGFTGDGGVAYTGVPASWPVVLTVAGATALAPSLNVVEADGSRSGIAITNTHSATGTFSLTINPTLSGGSQWGVAHLVVGSDATLQSGAVRSAREIAYATAMLGPRTSDTVPVPNQILAWADSAVTLTGATVGESAMPWVGDRDAADVIGALVTGMGARLVDALDGTLRWVPFADSTAPVAIPAGAIDPAVRWQTDSSGWVSDETVTWPDGTSYTATRPDGKRQSGSIEGVHATRLQDRSYADWLVNTASRGARLPIAPFDLASLPFVTRTNTFPNPGPRGSTSQFNRLAGTGAVVTTAIVAGVTPDGSGSFYRETWTTSPSVKGGGPYLNRLVSGSVPAGVPLSVSMKLRSSIDQVVMVQETRYTAGVSGATTTLIASLALPANTWVPVSVTIPLAGAEDGYILVVSASVAASTIWPVGATIDVTEVLETDTGTWFDGASTPAPHQTISWAGVANASASVAVDDSQVILCGIDPGDRVSFTGLPAHMPSSLTCICEGLDEQISSTSWDLTLKLSPDVYSRLLVWDSGNWDSGLLWAP